MNVNQHTCFYEGTVHHRRFAPVDHRFRYRVFFAFLDLDEVDRLLGRGWLWGTRLWAMARFRRTDHFGDPQEPLSESVRDLVEERIGRRPNGPIRLLTNLRYYGYVLNPVSFYYCYSVDGQTVDALVAEVTNTPWGERYCYVLDRPCEDDGLQLARMEHEKRFHVSPFMALEQQYVWKLREPGNDLRLAIASFENNCKVLEASLVLERRCWSRWNKLRLLLQYPWLTVKVFLAIYWQALRLWIRRVPFVPHPGRLRPLHTADELETRGPVS